MAKKRSDNLDWKAVLNKPIKQIPGVTEQELLEINKVVKKYPMRLNSYYLSLIKKKNDPIYKQCIPSIKELEDELFDDPLAEEENSPVKSVVHRYPDRALLFVSSQCAMYCRFCTRKRMTACV